MTRSSTPVLAPRIARANGRVPRGELWLGADLFAKAGLENNLEGHFRMVDRLGQDLLALSISYDARLNRSTGYRYFTVSALKQAQTSARVLLVVIDGPFQTLISENGLVDTLTRWRREKQAFSQAYQKACTRVTDLVQQCLDHSIAAVVFAEDLASERSAIANPKEIESVFLPFYTQTVSRIHQANAKALFHSCGCVRSLIPMIESSGFDGLAAIQDRTNDLIAIQEQYPALGIAMAGIDADILEADAISASLRERFCKRIRALCVSDGFILGSCCGLYSGNFLKRIQELYRLAEPIG